jgi:hypothetical protein
MGERGAFGLQEAGELNWLFPSFNVDIKNMWGYNSAPHIYIFQSS